MTTEFELLKKFADEFEPNTSVPYEELREKVRKVGVETLKALQVNHGHSWSESLSLMREALEARNINLEPKKDQ